jgi:hypothetical protein
MISDQEYYYDFKECLQIIHQNLRQGLYMMIIKMVHNLLKNGNEELN